MESRDGSAIADVNALVHGAAAAHAAEAKLSADASILPVVSPAEPKSYLDKVAGVVLGSGSTERHIVEAAKTGAMFFGGRVGLATTVVLYGLDQVKVGDNFGQAVSDIGLGAIKGTAMRGINAFAAAREFNIAGQAVTLGVGSRVLETGLDRRSWLNKDGSGAAHTSSYSFSAGRENIVRTLTDRSAAISDVTSFALGGALTGGINKYKGGGLSSNPFWKTTLTGAVFGGATAASGEIKREHDNNEQFSLGKVMQAAASQSFYSGMAMLPAALQARHGMRTAFRDSHGVTTFGEKGTYHYRMLLAGKDVEVTSSKPTRAGMNQARDQMTEMVDRHKMALAGTFGISFANGGEPIQIQSGRMPEDLIAREPRLQELRVLDEVLQKSLPGQFAVDGKTGIKFNFLRNQDGERSWAGLYEERDNAPNVFINNDNGQRKPMTERDRDTMPHDNGMRRASVEVTLTHEIAHNSDFKVRIADEEFERDIREKLGWHRFGENSSYEPDNHVLKDKEGNWWRMQPNKDWVLSNLNGEPVTASGAAAAPAEQVRVSNDEMMHKSAVRPISDYFDKPMEMMMEGFARFRIGGEERGNLLRKSPVLYEQVKRQDDRELAMHYGQNAAGQPLMVRLPDGRLAERNATSETQVADFEKEEAAKKNEERFYH